MTDTPLDPERALFQGPVTLRNLSSRLAVGDYIKDEEITSLFNEQILAPFRYAQESLWGIPRKTTGEPAFCHSADIAIRAFDLDYPAYTLKVCLLHDVVEELSKSPGAFCRHIRKIASEFGQDMAQDVKVLTNRYTLILGSLKGRTLQNLPFEQNSLDLVRDAVARLMNSVSSSCRALFQYEFDRILNHFFHRVDLSKGAKKARFDKKYSAFEEVIMQSYMLYIEEINDDAYRREGSSFYETPLVVKFLDMVDNLRTSEIGNWAVIEKILLKCEMALDKSFYLHHHICKEGFHETSFILLYDYLKYNLVEQLHERRRALSFLADTRFGYLADYLDMQIGRLQEKYQVSQSLVEGIARLRNDIKKKNQR